MFKIIENVVNSQSYIILRCQMQGFLDLDFVFRKTLKT